MHSQLFIYEGFLWSSANLNQCTSSLQSSYYKILDLLVDISTSLEENSPSRKWAKEPNLELKCSPAIELRVEQSTLQKEYPASDAYN